MFFVFSNTSFLLACNPMNQVLHAARTKLCQSIQGSFRSTNSLAATMSLSNTSPIKNEKLSSLSKEELIEKIGKLENACAMWRNKACKISEPKSKYDEMMLRFAKIEKKSSRRHRKVKVFDVTNCSLRKVAFKVVYFGWDYDGLQDNMGLDDTIERIFLGALAKTRVMVGDVEENNYTKCGRTDKGVSAFSQVFSLKVRSRVTVLEENDISMDVSPLDPEINVDEASSNNLEDNLEELNYCTILNNVLPKEIKVLGWCPVDENFSSRKSCHGREYKYFFPCGALNIEKMKEAAKLFEGEHDFRNFCKMNVMETTNFVRAIWKFTIDFVSDSTLRSDFNMCVATIRGTAFLYHQVRCMLAVLYLIGMGFEEPHIITEMFDVVNMPKKPQFGLMADYPLVLYNCEFDGLQWRTDPETSERLLAHFQSYWCELAIKSEMAKSMLLKWSELSSNTRLPIKNKTDCIRNMSEIENYAINGKLLGEKCTKKMYTKLRERQTGTSLEDKVAKMEARKRRKMDLQSGVKYKNCCFKT